MAKIIYSDEARADIMNITMFYLSEFGEETADKVINSILDRIEVLADFPESGSETGNVKLNNVGIRKIVSENYIALYSYERDNKFIYIHHIYRDRQNY